MAVTSFFFGKGLEAIFNKEVDFNSDTIKCMALTSTATPNQDTWKYKSDVTNEITGTGYTAGGATVTGSFTYTAGTNTFMLDTTDPTWADSTLTIRYLVFYDSTPATDATRPLLTCVDLGADVSSSGGAWTYEVPATGIAALVVA